MILSLFPGIGILDRGFEDEGFNVVRGPDRLWGGDIKRFHAEPGLFEGVVGGPPCQGFTRLVALIRHNGYKVQENLVPEFERVVAEAAPRWFVMENVEGAPLPEVPGYQVDPTLLDNRSLGGIQSRKHRFSFGTREGLKLEYRRQPAAAEWHHRVTCDARAVPVAQLAGGKPKRRPPVGGCRNDGETLELPDMVSLQEVPGDHLPEDFFTESPFRMDARRKMIGNAVCYRMARELARAVRESLAEAAA